MSDEINNPIDAIRLFSRSVKYLQDQKVIRSRRFIGDIGEWYIEKLYGAVRSSIQTEKGWDNYLSQSGQRLQVKTQSYDRTNRWNYLESDLSLFDRLIVVILSEDFSIKSLYDVPTDRLRTKLRIGSENKPVYFWDDLQEFSPLLEQLPGYAQLRDLIHLDNKGAA